MTKDKAKAHPFRGFPWVGVHGLEGLLYGLSFAREQQQDKNGIDVRFLYWVSQGEEFQRHPYAVAAELTLEQEQQAREHYAVQQRLEEMGRGIDMGPQIRPPALPSGPYDMAAEEPPDETVTRRYSPDSSICKDCGRHDCWLGSTYTTYTRAASGGVRHISVRPPRPPCRSSIEIDVEERIYRWIRPTCRPKEQPWIPIHD